MFSEGISWPHLPVTAREPQAPPPCYWSLPQPVILSDSIAFLEHLRICSTLMEFGILAVYCRATTVIVMLKNVTQTTLTHTPALCDGQTEHTGVTLGAPGTRSVLANDAAPRTA